MTAPPISVGPEMSVRAAAGVMAEKKIGCLPVVANGTLLGIVTETDVLSYFASQG